MGDGLACMGVPVTTFATAGEPIHPAFAEYAKIATLHSWGAEPGRTLAYEFSDGKLMHSAVRQLAEFTPEYIQSRCEEGVFQEACREASLIALTDWSLYPHMTACWHYLQKNVFPEVASGTPFLIDLVDPSSRSEGDIREMLSALPGFQLIGPVTLGLNQNEANILSRFTDNRVLDNPNSDDTARQATSLRETLQIHEVVIHSQKYAVCSGEEGEHCVDGPYCSNPKKSTGAGDRFNAGYALGRLLDLDTETRLLLAVATSGLYVRKGVSATLPELSDFLREWGS